MLNPIQPEFLISQFHIYLYLYFILSKEFEWMEKKRHFLNSHSFSLTYEAADGKQQSI